MDREERNKKVEENLALVTFSLNKLGIKFNEDYFQQGVLELIRCVECYNENSGCKFSTYAVKNITLKLKEYIMRDKVLKPKRTGVGGQVYAPLCQSFETPIGVDDKKEITLGEVIPYREDPYEIADFKIEIYNLIRKGHITQRDYDILIEYCVEGTPQKYIAKRYGVSQAEISITVKEVKEKLKKYLSYNNY